MVQPLDLTKVSTDIASMCRVCIPLTHEYKKPNDVCEKDGRVHFYKLITADVHLSPLSQVESECHSKHRKQC